MKVKSVLYASVGAPVVAAKKVGTKANEVYGRINEQATGYSEKGSKLVDSWAEEGEKTVVRVKDGKVVDEITSKVDLDQAKEQVGKLRDQLEDMLDTWRTSFRPEKSSDKVEKAPEKAEAKTAAKPVAKKPAAKTSTTKTSAKKTTAAKTSTAKTDTPSTAEKAS